MSDIPFPIIVAVLFLFSCLAILHFHQSRQDAQRALPQRDAYLAAQGGQIPTCGRCGATDTREFGLNEEADHRRVVACAKCNQLMFQYSRDTPE